MTTTESRQPERRPTGALSGICFVGLFVGGLVPFGDLLGSFADPDATFVEYFASSNNRAGNIVGGVLLGISAFVFIWFLYHLRQCLQPDDSHSATLPNLTLASGLVFVALLLVATAALTTVPLALAVGDAYGDRPFAAAQAVLPQLGYVVLAFYAMWAAGVMVISATVSARRSASFPPWLRRLSFVAAVFLFLLGPTVMGILALPVWVLTVSVHWRRNRNPPDPSVFAS